MWTIKKRLCLRLRNDEIKLIKRDLEGVSSYGLEALGKYLVTEFLKVTLRVKNNLSVC